MKSILLRKRASRGAMTALFCFFILSIALPAFGADYFVNKRGGDGNNGTSRETAFLTIQKGVNALKPGDTLAVGPGEYFENVTRANLGGPDSDTVIRAEVPGTVLLRGDVDVPPFEKVEGYRFVYGGPLDKTALAVLEHDTLRILPKRPNLRAVEYEPGTCYYDERSKRLYVSSSDLRAPGKRRYTASVNGKSGLNLTKPQRVIIEGLAATGFFPGFGIDLITPTGCSVRGCITFMNQGGIRLNDGGSDCVIENCRSYGNTFGGVACYRGNNYVVRNCLTYKNTNVKQQGETFGIMHYFGMKGPLLFSNNISWGQNFNLSVKPSGQERVERNVGLGFVRIRPGNMFHNLVGDGNEFDRGSEAAPDNILLVREEDLDGDFQFADPVNLDFRLQPDSRFRNTAPDGSDRGPYPYEANIFYVSPRGDDAADGLSMRKPWRTLERALKGLRSGDTLYLAEGRYEAGRWANAGGAEAPIRILGRGRGTAVIAGRQDVTGGAGIVFERLNFADGVALDDCREVAFENCTFFGNADGLNANAVTNLKVTQCVFDNVPINVGKSSGLFLSGNLYANAGEPAVVFDAADAALYSDYNNYQDAAQAWEVGGKTWSVADLKRRHDRYSRTTTPELVAEEGVPRLGNGDAFTGRGPASTALGVHYAYDPAPEALELAGPFLHSTSDTTANIEWWSSRPATFELAWGETPETMKTVGNVQTPDRFTTYSLTGLKPGVKYYFKIRSASADGGTAGTVLRPDAGPIAFTTMAAAPKPAVYYVAPNGNDGNTGLSRQQAWRMVSHAADTVNVGDTVLVAGGTYTEDVRIRATGDEGQPITFRCAPGEKVVFNGRRLPHGFKAVAKKHLNFDGFYFEDYVNGPDSVFVLWQSDNVSITRCLGVQGINYANFVSAVYCADLLVKNCVASHGMGTVNCHICPRLRVENNLIVQPFITAVNIVNKPEQKGFLSRNIITDNLPTKVHAPLLVLGRFESLVLEDNWFFLRIPKEEKSLFRFYGTAAYGRYARYGVTIDFKEPPVIVDNPDGTENNPAMTLKQYEDIAGDTGSAVGDPKFAGMANIKPRANERRAVFEVLRDKRGLDFPDTFATDPKAVEMGVGPQPDDFKDFWFNRSRKNQ